MSADWKEAFERGLGMVVKARPVDVGAESCGFYEGWAVGYYVMHRKRTLCPIGDSLKEEDVEHMVVKDGFSDWNMPRSMEAVEIDPGTICRCSGEKASNGAFVFENDLVEVDGEMAGKVMVGEGGSWWVVPDSVAGMPLPLRKVCEEHDVKVAGNRP